MQAWFMPQADFISTLQSERFAMIILGFTPLSAEHSRYEQLQGLYNAIQKCSKYIIASVLRLNTVQTH